MKKSTLLKAFGLLSLLFVFTACNKYEEGSNFSLISAKARMANTWTLTGETFNGNNQTIVGTTVYEFDKDGSAEYSYTAGSFSIELTGSWEFNDDKTKIFITYNAGDTEDFTIIQLKNKNLMLEEVDGDDTTVYTFSGV